MNFISLADLDDEIIECKQSDADEANDFLLDFAHSLGVKNVKILIPPVYTVKHLGVVYALSNAAFRSIGKDNLTSLDTESTREDIYAQKYRLLQAELAKLEASVTAADFTGKQESALSAFCVPLRRA